MAGIVVFRAKFEIYIVIFYKHMSTVCTKLCSVITMYHSLLFCFKTVSYCIIVLLIYVIWYGTVFCDEGGSTVNFVDFIGFLKHHSSILFYRKTKNKKKKNSFDFIQNT